MNTSNLHFSDVSDTNEPVIQVFMLRFSIPMQNVINYKEQWISIHMFLY